MFCLGSQGVHYRVVALFLVALLSCCLGGAEGFSLPRGSSSSVTPTTRPTTTTRTTKEESLQQEESSSTRRAFLNFCGTTTTSLVLLRPAHAIPEQKVYSANARNLDRLSAGDQSGGSVYNNNPSSPAAAKRRAMVGCKVKAARVESGVPNEKDCNTRVLGGDAEFMLEALRKLNCPTCPYGIQGA